nr:TetR/AcrR family transcriptional regulator [Rhodococcus sp. BS-15]
MPKIVDHDARRAEIVAAVWRVIERAGMDGATVRSVAAEAGVSPGSLRYYFSDQGELVLFAAEAMTQRVVHRLEAHPTDGDGLVRAIRVLEELLPLDEDRRAERRCGSKRSCVPDSTSDSPPSRRPDGSAAATCAGSRGRTCTISIDRTPPHSPSTAMRTNVQRPNCIPSSTG